MTYIRAFFLERGTSLHVVGDDVKAGDPMLLSVFTEENDVWLGVLQVMSVISKSSNKLVLKFGRIPADLCLFQRLIQYSGHI